MSGLGTGDSGGEAGEAPLMNKVNGGPEPYARSPWPIVVSRPEALRFQRR